MAHKDWRFLWQEATRSIFTPPPPPPPDGMLVPRRATPRIKIAGTHLFTWVERPNISRSGKLQKHKNCNHFKIFPNKIAIIFIPVRIVSPLYLTCGNHVFKASFTEIWCFIFKAYNWFSEVSQGESQWLIDNVANANKNNAAGVRIYRERSDQPAIEAVEI